MLNDMLYRLLYVFPAIVVALTFHEYAHGRVSYAFGDPTPRDAGRLTLNPLRHLDVAGTILLVIGGFGWAKPVPVNPIYYSGNPKRKLMWVALAGPVTNIVEALIGGALLAVLLNAVQYYNWFTNWLIYFSAYFIQINVVLAIFNMIPVPPLDGSKILAGLLPGKGARFVYALERYGFGILMLLVFLPEILGILGLPAIDPLTAVISRPANWIVDQIYTLYGIA